ncbi:tetratricopeptide repeat protein [Amycolatopsis sp. NPDC051071]|uniref:tetratricopeptide repeat protein n=1 Tax=Amycolatopsis sp. NPDC051071 TaxID=3154637 RepID=UPI00342BF39B
MVESHNEISGEVARNLYLGGSAPTALAGIPPVNADFTGRTTDLARIADALRPSPDSVPVVVSAVAGLAGVGKTTLAVKSAHDAVSAGWFPGGVLFVDMRGYSADNRLDPGEALSVFLQALGVAGEHIPPALSAREALYRSKLSERTGRVLVLVDNASSADQVRPLLPSSPHRVLVTSRHTLGDLHGARKIDLNVLPRVEAVAMLDTAVRTANPADRRVVEGAEAAGEVAEFCGYLPLALSIVAAILVSDPDQPISEMAAALRSSTTRLNELSYDRDLAVRAAFDLSYTRLERDDARLFRLLSLNRGPRISFEAAAALADLPPRDTAKILGRLRRAHMIEQGEPRGWFRFHDLLRLYAEHRVSVDESADACDAAVVRLLDYYVDAMRLVDEDLMPSPDALPKSRSSFRAERTNVVDAITLAHESGQYQQVTQLTFALSGYLLFQRNWEVWRTVYQLALHAARQLKDRPGEAKALLGLGRAARHQRDFDASRTRYHEALVVYRTLDDHRGEARALHHLGSILRLQGDYGAARVHYDDALALYRLLGKRHGEADIAHNLGTMARHQKCHDQARTHYLEALTICREIGDRRREARALEQLGKTARDQGDPAQARGHWQAAIVAYEHANDGPYATGLRRRMARDFPA